MAFEEAKVTTDKEPQEVQVSSNELVFMIGEGVLRDRQNLKRLQYLDKQVGIAKQETLNARSLLLSCEEKNMALEKVKISAFEEYKEKVDSLERVNGSLNSRIVQLEKQLHGVAIERDKYRNELAEIALKKPKRKIIKSVKHASNTSRN